MSDDSLARAMTEARRVAAQSTEFKSETYMAILLSELLRGSAESAVSHPQEPSTGKGAVVAQEGKQFSAAELFAACTCSSEIDKVVAAGYFLERYGAVTSYGLGELRQIFVSAKVPVPKNPSYPIFKAVQRGWMMVGGGKAKGKGQVWTLTQSGLRHVEAMLQPTSKDSGQ